MSDRTLQPTALGDRVTSSMYMGPRECNRRPRGDGDLEAPPRREGYCPTRSLGTEEDR